MKTQVSQENCSFTICECSSFLNFDFILLNFNDVIYLSNISLAPANKSFVGVCELTSIIDHKY